MLGSTHALRALSLRLLFCIALCLAALGPAVAQVLPTPAPAEPAEAADPRAALAEILRDDASREALIAELERLATGEELPSLEPASEVAVSVSRQIAQATQAVAQAATENALALWAALLRVPEALDGLGLRELGILVEAFQDLLLVIGATAVAFVVLRLGARPVYRRMGAKVRDGTVARRWLMLLASVMIDAALVIVAWAIGYALAATVIGQFGEVAIRQSLYLNAFLAVETVKVLVRAAVCPAAPDLRPVPISDRGARRLYRPLNIGISIIGYGLLLVVPIVNEAASFRAGNSVAAAVILLAALYLAAAVLRRRQPVADWLIAQARTPVTAPVGPRAPILAPGDEEGGGEIVVEELPSGEMRLAEEPPRAGLYATLARKWHVAVLVWLAYVAVTALSASQRRVFEVLEASALIAAALVVGTLVSGMLGRAVGRGVRLPPYVALRLPGLEARLNGFVPKTLTALRILLIVAVVLFSIDAAGLFDVSRWLSTPRGLSLIGTIVSVVAILVVAFALYLALSSWVEYRLNPEFGSVPTAREQTLLTLLRNALTIVLLVLALMFALSEIGLDIGPLIASAGVLGLAIGFGAQKLVQDVITGIFIQLENAMNVGDVVTAGPVTGVVEKLTIRSVSLRDLQGVYHLIPFSSVDAVSNFMRDFSFHVADIGVAYREDVDEAKQAMFDAFEELKADPEHGPTLLDDLQWFGVEAFADSAVVLRARIKTLPGKQWGVGRAFNGYVKRIFDARGIEIPFPHTTLYFGEDKAGRTQTLKVAGTESEDSGPGDQPSAQKAS
jgi:small-conductance mechanosensitive channel